jgi:dephospho-CoA kinase
MICAVLIIIGLTGGIGMGKSAVAKILRGFGLPVYNADRAVHALLKKGGKAVKPVAKIFPEVLKRSAIDRKILGRIVFGHKHKLKKLEKILHPLVRREEKRFLAKARKQKKPASVLEIPLLFETGGDKRCDVTICVMAPKKVQMARVMQRPGMNRQKFKAIQALQMPDKKKRQLADYVVDTGGSIGATRGRLVKGLGVRG